MKKCASYILFTMLIACIACACSSDIDIKQVYEFSATHMPVPKKLKQGETAEIRLQLHRQGEYDEAKYFIRYFQPDGKGSLKMDNGTVFLPNDLYALDKEVFRLYYTSASSDQQVIDVYIEDNYGQVIQLSFAFNNENSED